jgi:uncharacterized YccA/Bax inhibitor family protein
VSNPVLNENAWKKASGTSTLPPPQPGQTPYLQPGQVIVPPPIEPATDGPISAWTPAGPEKRMTLRGSLTATGVLLALVVAGGFGGWVLTDAVPATEFTSASVDIPGWLWFIPIAALVLGLVIAFKPKMAPVLSPLYSVGYGVFLGAISKAFEVQYEGIVLQAVGATLGVSLVMLFLYAFRIVRVTNKTRAVIIGATLGIMAFYLVGLVVSLFGGQVPFINSTSIWGILFSVLVAGIAALNLLLDFDFIERASAAGAPRYMEWYAAFGVTVTIIWLYLEILRLLAKIRSN